MSLPRFLLFGSKEQKNLDAVEPRAVQVAPSGGMKVWLDGMRNTFSVAMTAVVSSLPNIVVSTMPSLTANPTKPVSLAHGLLGATLGTLYTFAAAHRAVVIHICNVDTVERTVTIQINATTPGAADDTHTRLKTHRLDVGDFVQVTIPGAVSTDIIYGLCDSANKVSYEIWGIP